MSEGLRAAHKAPRGPQDRGRFEVSSFRRASQILCFTDGICALLKRLLGSQDSRKFLGNLPLNVSVSLPLCIIDVRMACAPTMGVQAAPVLVRVQAAPVQSLRANLVSELALPPSLPY